MLKTAKECIDFLDQLREQSEECEDPEEFNNIYDLVVHNPNRDPPKRDGKSTRLFRRKKKNKNSQGDKKKIK